MLKPVFKLSDWQKSESLITLLYVCCWGKLDAWGWCTGTTRGMVWGGRREEGSGWGTHVY